MANSIWFACPPGSITASPQNNTVYIANNSTFSGATTIYGHIDGNANSLSAPFITVPIGKELYGSGIGYVPQTNQLAVTTVKSGFGTNYGINDLYFYDLNGTKVGDLQYSGYYFPAIPVFH
jgi:hypothetical protein